MNEATSNSNSWMNVTVLPGMVKGTTEIVLLTIEKLADTQAKLNDVLSLRDQRKTWTSLAHMCLQMGDHEGARHYMSLLSASAAPAPAPTGSSGPPSVINTSTQSPAAAGAAAGVDNILPPLDNDDNDEDDDDELFSPVGGGKTTGLEQV
jgi:hypothetical protein